MVAYKQMDTCKHSSQPIQTTLNRITQKQLTK